MKKILFSIFIFSAFIFSKIYSQEISNMGVHLEAEFFSKFKSNENLSGTRLSVTPSYKIAEKMTVGIGTGVKYYSIMRVTNDVGNFETEEKGTVAIPLYMNTMYKFKANKKTPFVECKLGYIFDNTKSSFKSDRLFPEYQGEVEIQGSSKGGIFFSPSIGYLFTTYKKQFLSLSLAYSFERYSSKTNVVQVNKIYKDSTNHHFAAIRVGYIF